MTTISGGTSGMDVYHKFCNSPEDTFNKKDQHDSNNNKKQQTSHGRAAVVTSSSVVGSSTRRRNLYGIAGSGRGGSSSYITASEAAISRSRSKDVQQQQEEHSRQTSNTTAATTTVTTKDRCTNHHACEALVSSSISASTSAGSGGNGSSANTCNDNSNSNNSKPSNNATRHHHHHHVPASGSGGGNGRTSTTTSSLRCWNHQVEQRDTITGLGCVNNNTDGDNKCNNPKSHRSSIIMMRNDDQNTVVAGSEVDGAASSVATTSELGVAGSKANMIGCHGNTSGAPAAAASKCAPDAIVIEEKRLSSDGGYSTLHYIRGPLLGKGGFAKVYHCTATDTGKQYAAKVVPKANLVKARARQKLQAEIKIHRTLKHTNICEFKHYFEDRENCYILLELCHNQSLNEMIKRRKRLTEPEAAYFMIQLIQAVNYMHDQCVIHRDLKLGNLFLDKKLNIKVGDLGLATRMEKGDEKRKTICGTPNYIAPEIIQGDKSKRGHSFEVDIWSMGVILYTILIGKPPYEAKDVKSTYQRILSNDYTFPRHIEVSDIAKSLVEFMLKSDPSERPSLDMIEAHPFLCQSLLPSCIPTSALHIMPEWELDSTGSLVSKSTGTKRSTAPKATLTRTVSGRQPFAARDINQVSSKTSHILPSTLGTSRVVRKEKSNRDVIDVRRVVKTAITMSGKKSTASSVTTSSVTPTTTTASSSSTNPGFKILDEALAASVGKKGNPLQFVSKFDSADNGPKSIMSKKEKTSNPKQLESLGEESHDECKLGSKTKALSVASVSSGNTSSGSNSAVSNKVNEADIFKRMLHRFSTVLEIAEARQGYYRQQSFRTLPSRHGPVRWVTRYVDYTSKYGLGFLLNDGGSGVYFNDSTKTALEPNGESFQYIERRRIDEESSTTGPSLRGRMGLIVETHTLSSYPDSLKKKVTLMTHFRNYLLEQQNGCKNEFAGSAEKTTDLCYVKKWVRTKHAILFRLSDNTVQVVFYDQTEVLCTPDTRYITYVDKTRRRSTYEFTDAFVGSSNEILKRLKYTKEIMDQISTTTTTTTTTASKKK